MSVSEGAASISDLVRRTAQVQPTGLALIDGAARLSWADLDHEVTRAALALRAADLDDGDRIALQLVSSSGGTGPSKGKGVPWRSAGPISSDQMV